MKRAEKTLGAYYFLFSDFGIDWGIPSRNPTALALKALTLYNAYLSGKSERLEKALLEDTELLVETFHPKEDYGVWLFDFLFPRAELYNCKQPWPSALTQGLAISALVRAYSLKPKPEFLETARLALNAFEVPVARGGVLSVDADDGDWWFEEYAGVTSRPSGVLNGFIISLFGLLDFFLLSKDNTAKRLFDKGISTLNRHLRDFDVRYPFQLSYYDRLRHLTTIQYHSFHVKLLGVLHKMTGQVRFREYQQRWNEYRSLWEARADYRLLSRMHYVKSGYSLKETLKLLARLVFEEKKFRATIPESFWEMNNLDIREK